MEVISKKPREATMRIAERLIREGYRELWSMHQPQNRTISMWARNGKVLLLEESATTGGCEIYKPLVDTVQLQPTLDAISEYGKVQQ